MNIEQLKINNYDQYYKDINKDKELQMVF